MKSPMPMMCVSANQPSSTIMLPMPANVLNTKKFEMGSAFASQDLSRMVQVNASVHSFRKSKMELAYVKQDSSEIIVAIVFVRLTKNSLDQSVSARLPLYVIMEL
jgi:hypothetical protein